MTLPDIEARGRALPTRLFQNGNSQAVRIPKALAFADSSTEVEIERRGDMLIVRPVRRQLTGLGADFRKLGRYFRGFKRDQPPMDRREWGPQDGSD